MSTVLAIVAAVLIIATFASMSPMWKPNGWRTALLAVAALVAVSAAGAAR